MSEDSKRELTKLDETENRVEQIEKLTPPPPPYKVEQSAGELVLLRKEVVAANNRIDELVALIHNMAQQMITHGYNLSGTGYDIQTLGRIICDRFPLSGAQQEIVNKSKQQPSQPSNIQ